jgi:hypothetical protein
MFGERSRAHVRIKRRFLRDQQIDDTDITIRIARLVTNTASERIGAGTARTIRKGDILHAGQHRPLGNARLDAALDQLARQIACQRLPKLPAIFGFGLFRISLIGTINH